jgi:flagellum-specific peptidoglycan hydrolase FlgJ
MNPSLFAGWRLLHRIARLCACLLSLGMNFMWTESYCQPAMPTPVFTPSSIPANVLQFIDRHLESVQKVAAAYDIPAPVILGVSGLESGWGTSELSREANNFFGIKAFGWTGESYAIRTWEFQADSAVAVTAEFRRYATAEESFEDFARLLRNSKRYQWFLDTPCDKADYWGSCLQQAGYSTDPNYPKKLTRIITDYQLWRYCYTVGWSDGESR